MHDRRGRGRAWRCRATSRTQRDPKKRTRLMIETPPPADGADPEYITEVAQLPPHPRDGYGLPRGLIIILGLAAGVVVAAGIHSIPNILGPVFMAVVLVVTLDPIRGWLIRKGAPRWLASLAVILGIYVIVIGLF